MSPHSTARRRRWLVTAVSVVLVAALVGGLLTGALSAAARAGLSSTGLLVDGGAPTITPDTFSRPAPAKPSRAAPTAQSPSTPAPERADGPKPVLRPFTAGRLPRASRLAATIKAVESKDVAGSFSGSVVDVSTGRVLYRNNSTKGYLPASTMKLLTSTAALSILGPGHRFRTRVVTAGAGSITLVGGGDPYLSAAPDPRYPQGATLSRLARLTAAELRRSKQTRVALGYDTSLFSGASWHPDWPALYRDQVTPLSSLWVNEGRVAGATGARVAKPAKSAADAFARALRMNGIRVTRVSGAVASRKTSELAMVESMPLDRIVERLLMVSDNDASEVVARQAAIGAGQPGSFVAGRAAISGQLKRLGIASDALRLRDGSGLSRRNRIPADLLTRLVRLSLSSAHPELRAVATGLPVAGVEGSLRIRFNDRSARAGRGVVRGKTGTLTGAHGLAGFVRSKDGALLAYAFLVNDTKNGYAARLWLDRVTSAISTCGCR